MRRVVNQMTIRTSQFFFKKRLLTTSKATTSKEKKKRYDDNDAITICQQKTVQKRITVATSLYFSSICNPSFFSSYDANKI